MDPTTPNIVGSTRTMLGFVASVLAVVRQLPTMLGPAVHRGKDTTILWRPCVMRVCGPNNVGRAVQTDPTLLRYASAITEQKKCWSCWLKSLTGFKLCATTPNNMQQQQGVQTDATCNIQQCSSVCTGLYIVVTCLDICVCYLDYRKEALP